MPKKYNLEEMVGNKWGRLTLVKEVEPKKYIDAKGRRRTRREALFKCDCGTPKTIDLLSVVAALRIKSCGCLHVELSSKRAAKRNFKHGQAVRGRIHPLYKHWRSMLDRCYSLKYHAYAQYGGRGISVCGEWLDDVQCFMLALEVDYNEDGIGRGP